MAFITINDIERRPFRKAQLLNENFGVRKNYDRIFLSYSHNDKGLVYKIAEELIEKGADIYVDYLDESLIGRTNEEVAATLRTRISKSKKFISLFTPNSDKSKWMAWELGLGDGLINYENVAMLPIIVDPKLGFDTEFKRIYARIEKRELIGLKGDWFIRYPDGTIMSFISWLNK